MAERLLPENLSFDGPFPRLSRRLRLGVVGGGRISVTQATAARMTDRWEVAAGALSSDAARSKARGPSGSCQQTGAMRRSTRWRRRKRRDLMAWMPS